MQGAYWLTTGIWPLLHYKSFVAVTGPKREPWLVKTAGVLIASIGATLLASGRREVTPETRLLGLAGAAGLAAIDLVYSLRGTISPIYLADAGLETGFIAAWALARPHVSSRRQEVR